MQGLYFPGVQREFQSDKLKSNDEQWIRDIFFTQDQKHFIIVCCTALQARAYAKCEHIEMDMSFKMVAGKTNLFSLVGWDPCAKRRFYLY